LLTVYNVFFFRRFLIMKTRKWNARWICGVPGEAAPYLRQTFALGDGFENVTAYVCGLGFHELSVNGSKADDRELAPVITQYDKRAGYIAYDITHLVRCGKNVITVLLGNGFYNTDSQDSWGFEHASWKHIPKLLCEVVADGKTVLSSDNSWKSIASPITFNQVRNGEFYDARLEISDLDDPDLEVSSWVNCRYCNPPGGLIAEEDCEPCKVTEKFACQKIAQFCSASKSSSMVFDVGENITGRCVFEVKGAPGTVVELVYAEHILENGDVSQDHISTYVKKHAFQTERYTLKGNGPEKWHSRFTWHGFRYCKIYLFSADCSIELLDFYAEGISTAFENAGSFESSCDTLNRLQKITRRSYISNFTGIPTDCPHREKNGWTGDAQIAIECGLWNFKAAKAAAYFVRTLIDTQRVNGQLPGIAPTGGWGYNWGSGPGWDIALFEIPWRIRLFTGDSRPLENALPAMEKYLDYALSMSTDYLVDYGLGDWSCSRVDELTASVFTSTAYFYYAAKIMSYCKPEYAALAEAIKGSLNRNFYRGNGIYSDGKRTALAAALYFGIAPDEVKQEVVEQLVKAIRERNHTTGFGIFGAKYILRVLADYGYLADAYKLATQKEFPGWGYWVAKNATTLWERWDGSDSQNHIMFGDISAWMFEYLAGIKPDVDNPGFKRFTVKPAYDLLDRVNAVHEAPDGKIHVCYERADSGKISGSVTVPEKCTADVFLPDGSSRSVSGSTIEF